MADITNQNEATVSNNNVRSEMPRIWRISHSHINDVDHQKLIENNMLAIGFLENMERGVTTIRDRFSNIGNGDYFYLVRRGYIVLFGQFGETNQTGIINEDMIAFNGQKLDFSKQLNGWLYRQINKLNASSTPFANNNIKCDPKDKILKYMPSGQSTVFEVPKDKLGQFETDVLRPVFDRELKNLNIEASTSPSNTPNLTPSDNIQMITLNKILFGPPGTGKTYNTINKSIEIANPSFDLKKSRSIIKTEFDNLIKGGQIVFTTFHQSMSYEDFIEGIKPLEPIEGDAFVKYLVKSGIFKQICDQATKNEDKNYVLIIDEINRGNVSQIFGELITLIEDDKRLGCAESLEVILPYSKKPFGVPKNLYIIGTMNTADRSIEALDAALRRRFSFEEMAPNSDLIATEGALNETNGILDLEELGDVNLPKLLDIINRRIEKLLDKDHQIGHSYFMSIGSLDDLKLAFQTKIIPLLQEYFFGDYGKIGLVLGNGFVSIQEEEPTKDLFADFDYADANDFSDRIIYKINSFEIGTESDKAFSNAIKTLLN